jgi:hypothetical protein
MHITALSLTLIQSMYMFKKRILKYCLTICLLLPFAVMAQLPEKIYSITRVMKPNSYYTEQAALWKKEIDKNRSNADAWLNYYRANRYIQISAGEDGNFGKDRFARLSGIVQEMQAAIPNTFEANFVQWINGGADWNTLFPYLQKAYDINPNRTDTYADFVSYYETTGDFDKRDFFAKKWYASGEVSPGLLNYNYNVLMSLKPNALLITVGDNDTYPVWVLQAALGIRKDVKVINIYLSSLPAYHELLNKELGVTLPALNDTYPNTKNIITQLAANKSKRPVYAGLTACNEWPVKSVENDLYLTGLAYEYRTKQFDNIPELKRNMEQSFALDYLKVNFVNDPSASTVVLANTNYIVPMLSMYEHYKSVKQNERAQYWKAFAKQVAVNSGMEAQFNNYVKD